jgi:hypothetical protein
MPISRELASALAKKASLAAHHPDQDLTEINVRIKEIRASDFISELIATRPPLSADARDRLAGLLRSEATAAAAADLADAQ